jgi:hypothetical protein
MAVGAEASSVAVEVEVVGDSSEVGAEAEASMVEAAGVGEADVGRIRV